LAHTVSKPWSSPVAKNIPSHEKLVVMITRPLVLASHNAGFSMSGVVSLGLVLIVGVQVSCNLTPIGPDSRSNGKISVNDQAIKVDQDRT